MIVCGAALKPLRGSFSSLLGPPGSQGGPGFTAGV